MKIRRFTFIISVFFLSMNLVHAQKRELQIKHLSVKDGLSQSTVFCVLQDAKGFMWFGTRTGGLNKYDGYSFTAYKNDPDDSCSISGNEIVSLFEDSKGNMWIGTRNYGLNRLDYNTDCFHHYFNTEGDSNVVINDIVEDSKGRVWLSTYQELCYYDAENDTFIRNLVQNQRGEFITINKICVAGNYFWLGAKNGLYLYDPKKKKVIKSYLHDKENEQSLGDNYVTSLILDKKNRLWVGTKKVGINCLVDAEKGIFKRYPHDSENKNSIASNIIRTIQQDKNGVIWVGTKKGLDQLMPKEQEKENPVFHHHQQIISDKENTLSENSIYSFYEDTHGDFWVGTWSGGVNHIKNAKPKFEHIANKRYNDNSLSNNKVSAFFEDKNGLWVATEEGGLNFIDKKTQKFTHYKQDSDNPTGLNSNHVKSFHVDKKGNFWVGTFKGLHLFDRQTKQFKVFLKNKSIYTIISKTDNILWVGTSKYMYAFDTQTQEIVKEYKANKEVPNAIYESNITVIHKTKNGTIWVGAKRGLHRYNPEKDDFVRFMHSVRDRNRISDNHVTSIDEDLQGNLWIGTYNGLNKYDAKTGTFLHFSEKIGLPDNAINSMIIDNQDIIWITTNKGLTRFNPIPKENGEYNIRTYDKLDGLQENEFIKGSVYKNSEGILYFGGSNGFNIINPSNIKNNTNIPKVVITDLKLLNKSVKVNGKDSPLSQHISATKELELDYKQASVFTLEFVALNYMLPEKNQYAYILEGFDKKWNYIGNNRDVTYTNLPAGEYTFKVKASNNDGIWNEEGVSLKIRILPPWWNTKSFKGIATIIVLVMILSFYFYRINTLKKQKRALEEKVNHRTTELKKAVNQLEYKQEEILQQSEEIKQQNEEMLQQTEAIQLQNHEIQKQAKELKQSNSSLEAQKTEIEKSYNNSQILSDFGQRLTATFDADNIHEMAYQYLISLMDISAFGIGIYNKKSETIDFHHFIDDGKQVPFFYRKLDNKNSLVSWCFNEQKAVYIHDLENEYQNYLEDKPKYSTDKPPLSNIHIPLSVDTKQIGIIAVNNFDKNVYSENDFTLLKTIASHLAIALDNANAYREINTKNRHIESSIRYAKTIQQVILPPKERISSFYRNFILYRPKDIVSGDFYWNASVSDDCFIIAVVDCTGHGVPGAFMSIIGTNLLDDIVKNKHVHEPNKILEQLNRRVKIFLKQNEGHNDDGMDICLCKIDKTENYQYNVTFSGAKRPLYYTENQEFKSVKGTNKSIGGRSNKKTEFENHTLLLESDDMLYLTSDGYIDQCNPNRRKFGTTQFQKMLKNISDKPLNEQLMTIEQSLDKFQEHEEQRDDITILGFRL